MQQLVSLRSNFIKPQVGRLGLESRSQLQIQASQSRYLQKGPHLVLVEI